MKKRIINIRGASASGKTTAVKQFCLRNGFSVEEVETPFGTLPVSVLNNRRIVVLGDYAGNGNCLGTDRYKNGKSDIIDCIMEVSDKYNPDIIIYENMIGSTVFKGTKEIAKIAAVFGYEYFGIHLQISDKKRLRNLYSRAGKDAGLKGFKNKNKRTERAAEMLKEAGFNVVIVNVENIKKQDMWRIVDDAIRAEVK